MKAFGFVRGSDLVLCVLSAKKLTGPLVCELSLLNSGTGAVFSETRGVESCSGVDDVAAKTVQRLRAGPLCQDSCRPSSTYKMFLYLQPRNKIYGK